METEVSNVKLFNEHGLLSFKTLHSAYGTCLAGFQAKHFFCQPTKPIAPGKCMPTYLKMSQSHFYRTDRANVSSTRETCSHERHRTVSKEVFCSNTLLIHESKLRCCWETTFSVMRPHHPEACIVLAKIALKGTKQLSCGILPIFRQDFPAPHGIPEFLGWLLFGFLVFIKWSFHQFLAFLELFGTKTLGNLRNHLILLELGWAVIVEASFLNAIPSKLNFGLFSFQATRMKARSLEFCCSCL